MAREYGLPAVAGLAEATRRLKDGQHVRVDGQNGQVTLLDDGAGRSSAVVFRSDLPQ